MDEMPKAAVNRKSIDLNKISAGLFGRQFGELDGAQQEAVVREMERLANRPFVNDLGGGEVAEVELDVVPDVEPQRLRPARGVAAGGAGLNAQAAQWAWDRLNQGRAEPQPIVDEFEPQENDEDDNL